MRMCDLRKKEVINLCDCKRLGYVLDMEFDLCTGCIESIVVPIECGFCGILGNEKVYVIPLECVVKIGADFLMVEIKEEKYIRKSH